MIDLVCTTFSLHISRPSARVGKIIFWLHFKTSMINPFGIRPNKYSLLEKHHLHHLFSSSNIFSQKRLWWPHYKHPMVLCQLPRHQALYIYYDSKLLAAVVCFSELDILSQIIDSSPCFPERFGDFSCMKFPFKTKQKVLSHVSFWSDIYKKCQKWFWIFEAYLEWNFCNL